MNIEIPDGWREYSCSDVFYLFIRPDVLPKDAKFLDEILTITIVQQKQFAEHNKVLKDAKSEETRKACREWMLEIKEYHNERHVSPVP